MSDLNVLIDFTPEDGPEQTLYASMSAERFAEASAAVEAPGNADGVLVIPASLSPGGEVLPRTFRVGRIRLRAL